MTPAELARIWDAGESAKNQLPPALEAVKQAEYRLASGRLCVKLANEDLRIAKRLGPTGLFLRLRGLQKKQVQGLEAEMPHLRQAVQNAEHEHREAVARVDALRRAIDAGQSARSKLVALVESTPNPMLEKALADQADLQCAFRHLDDACERAQWALENSPTGIAGGVDLVTGGLVGMVASQLKRSNLRQYQQNLIALEKALERLDGTQAVHAPELVDLVPSWSPAWVPYDRVSEVFDWNESLDAYSLWKNRRPNPEPVRYLLVKLARLRLLLMERERRIHQHLENLYRVDNVSSQGPR